MKLYDATITPYRNRPSKHQILRATSEAHAKQRAKKMNQMDDGGYPKVTVKEICQLYEAYDANGDPIWVSIPEA